MRPFSVDASSHESVKANLAPGAPAPHGVRLGFWPRIRCNDCPGKLYTAQPGRVEQDFEVHLRNRRHIESTRRRAEG